MYRINPDYNELVTTVLTVVARDTHYKNYLNIQFPVIVFISILKQIYYGYYLYEKQNCNICSK